MGTHVIAVVGATATGKSGLAIALARALCGEIVNADSMQLYRGMDIGTAKEPETAWQSVPHHLLDIWPVTRTANVADYQKLARAATDDIIARSRIPVLVGGSGLYLRAALDDLNFPRTDHGTRVRLESELAELGAAELHARLAGFDPAAAAAILPSNGRRIVRALEVIELTGRPFTASMPTYEQVRPAVQVGLTLPRPELDQRIAARVDRMWQAGFQTEVTDLVRHGLRDGKTASRALGYQQMLRHLDGELTLDQARDETVKATRRFARRQESWFRRDPRIRWLDANAIAGADREERVLAEAIEYFQAKLLPYAPYVLGGGAFMVTLRVVDRVVGSEHAVELQLDGPGPLQSASVRFGFELSARDREDIRWYLEDYLQYPVEPAPEIARGVEARLTALGEELFRQVFRTSPDAMELWFAVKGSLSDARVEVATGLDGAAGIPWELLRDPATDGALALRSGAFVRALAETAAPVRVPPAQETLRVLLVICRPGGRADVPFRSVASHLVRLSSGAREVFQLDVLRPPTFAQLDRVLQAARVAGAPYHVVHFDGHGAWLDDDTVADGTVGELDQQRFSILSPLRSGSHGYLVFEDPSVKENQQLVDGPALGQLLVDGGVPVLVLNACRSAHAGLATEPEQDAGLDAHGRVRAYGSLAQEVMDAGVAGVVAMGYNVYVVTAAQFIGEVYAALLVGRELGQAVTAARRQLAASPLRQVSLEPRPLQDWLVPVVFEAAPLALRAIPQAQPELVISLSQAEAGIERAGLDPAQLAAPDVGFYGRDETLLALDRAFDTARIVLLHAWAGAGKTTTALEFARWYELTGAVEGVLFTPFTRHLPLARLLDQIGDQFGPSLAQQGMDWATLDDLQRRELALQVLAQVPLLWVWDNVEPVAGFPVGTSSAWTQAEQDELVGFLRDLAKKNSGCKVLLTSRRDEHGWLGDLPSRVALPPMPMLERLELAKAVASRQTGTGQRFLEVEDWRPLLDFTQGNPLTVTVLTRQALRDGRHTRDQVEAFVSDLRSGAATVTDDARQGRGASLAASLDYGFEHAFTDTERAQLALLALFQGFIDVDALRAMGEPGIKGGPVTAVAELDREHGIALLDRAAETGVLTSYGNGYYDVHPAIPWHLRRLFEHHYGPPTSPAAERAIQAWTAAIGRFGSYWHDQYGEGHAEVIGVLGGEEDNLLRARQLARQNGWWDLVIGPMQGLRNLYQHAGRAVEWRRLVAELTPDLANPETDGPLPGREDQWELHTEYRVRIAREALNWPRAQNLQEAIIAWQRLRAASALAAEPETLSISQRSTIRSLAVGVEGLGHILREQGNSDCLEVFLEAMNLYQRTGDRHGEGSAAYNLGRAYTDIPAVRDLEQAEHWYTRSLQRFEAANTFRRAQVTGSLATVAYHRFLESRQAGEPAEQLARYLESAANGYQQALQLLPTEEVGSLAAIHNQLGVIYTEGGATDRALQHYRQSIQYEERQDNRYGAGQSRLNAAITLWRAGRQREALLYAQAALRDFETRGLGAAEAAEQARQIITQLQQEPPDEPDGGTDA